MDKVLYFDIAAVPVILILFWTTIFRKMTRGRSNVLYLLLLTSAGLTVLWELVERLPFLGRVPLDEGALLWVKITEYAYFICRNATNLLYTLLLFSMTRTWYHIRPLWKKTLVVLPYLGILFMLLINERTNAVFYVTPVEGYERGDRILIVYALAFIYFVFGTFHIVRYRKTLERGSFIAFLSMYFLNAGAVLLQLFFPRLLIEAFATSMTLMFVVLFVQRPEEKVDMNTGLPGYRAFCHELTKISVTGQDVEIMIISMKNAAEMSLYLGEKTYYSYLYTIDEQIRLYARKERIDCEIYFEQPGNFYIILEDPSYNPTPAIPVIKDRIRKAHDAVSLSGAHPDPGIVTVFFPQEIADVQELLSFGHHFGRFVDVDRKFSRASVIIEKKEYRIETHIDEILSRAVNTTGFAIRYEPVFSVRDDRFVSAEAVPEVSDEEYGLIDPSLLLHAAEEKGLGIRLGEYLLEQVFARAGSMDFTTSGYSHLDVGLSVSMCMQRNLTDRIWELREKYGVHPERICFLVRESVYANMSGVLNENLKKLSMQGYLISLTGFGKGYSNMQSILELPIGSVRIDRSMITAARDSAEGKALLRGSIRMLQEIPLIVIAKGVDDEDTAGMLTQMGCDLLQGESFKN